MPPPLTAALPPGFAAMTTTERASIGSEELARYVVAVLELGESDAQLLDGPRHRKARWDTARAALFELLERLERAHEEMAGYRG